MQGKEVQFYIAATKTFCDFLSCIRNHSNAAEFIQWLIITDKSLGYGIQHLVATVRCSANIHVEEMNETKITFKKSRTTHTRQNG